ncbi:hypothetical protein [Breoghania sp. JC706]|uniref:hypothetical protein n=1 Tax=Breoghania sp. JC706 TaxID=3117732 RepID=UPI003009B08B
MCTTFACFLAALLAFESGWDRDRYEAGGIADWQLTQWAGGPVESHYPGYASWNDLSEAEWREMSYRSTNSLGFVGYQFGEALLIDLGYYEATTYYGAGSATNTWNGTWTGKNGVSSLDDFKTAEAQNRAIQEAFGYNLQILQNQLAAYGRSIDDYVGTTGTYTQGGKSESVELTLSGILAATHLRGAWGTASLLLEDAVSSDENGTSILQYIDQFGGYDTPGVDALIGTYEGHVVGQEGLGALLLEGDPAPEPAKGDGQDEAETPPAEVAEASGSETETPAGPAAEPADETPGTQGAETSTSGGRTLPLGYAWGERETVTDFDPASDVIDFGAMPGADIEITEVDGDLLIAVRNNGGSGYLLKGIQAEDLGPDNLTADAWNPVLESGGVRARLQALGAR